MLMLLRCKQRAKVLLPGRPCTLPPKATQSFSEVLEVRCIGVSKYQECREWMKENGEPWMCETANWYFLEA